MSAKSPTIVSLNIGMTRVTMARFACSPKNKALTLHKVGVREVNSDPSLPDGARLLQVRQAIAELVEELKVKNEPVWYALPGQSVFTKSIKILALEDSELDKLVKFEAQQQVPFPIDEVAWSYHAQTTNSGEKEAVLLAIKHAELNEYDSMVNQAGLKTEGLNTASMALYNAFRNSYAQQTEPALLLDLGARTTNLIFIENGRIYTRSIAIGGASVTAAIAKEYNVSFGDAEHSKLESGLVLLGGGHSSQLSEDVAQLGTIIRNALTRIVSQIPQTINMYRSQQGGAAPQHVYLCGGMAALPYAKEFLEERLHLPVSYFNPMHNVSVGPGVNAEYVASATYLLGEVVGMALQGFDQAAIKMSLLPQRIVEQRDVAGRIPKLVAGVACFVLASGLFAWKAFDRESKNEKLLTQSSESSGQLNSLSSSIKSKQSQLESAARTADALATAALSRREFADIINDIASRTATDALWFVDFEAITGFDENKRAGLSGNSYITDAYRTNKSELSVLVPTKPVVQEQGNSRRGGKSEAEPAANNANVINAIRIRGMARIDKDGQNAVFDLVKKLEASNYFVFKDKNNKNFERSQLVEFGTEPAGSFVKPFTVVLPLANPRELNQ